jgi:hypothetical protein
MRITRKGLYICREYAIRIFRECYIRRCGLLHWCEFGGTIPERVLVTAGRPGDNDSDDDSFVTE